MTQYVYPPVTPPTDNCTVLILGAGASYGSNLHIKPPVMGKFIKEGKEKVTFDYTRLWEFLNSIGYSVRDIENGKPNLEELYTILQTISSGLWYGNENELLADIGNKFWKCPPGDYLESFIVEVLSISSNEALISPCNYHDTLVKGLKIGDSIISFNYDLLIDISLSKNSNWSELGGYGFPCWELWCDEPGCRYNTSNINKITLLKPHGSLNWRLKDETTPLKELRQKLTSAENTNTHQLSVIPITTLEKYPEKVRGVISASFVSDLEKGKDQVVDTDIWGGLATMFKYGRKSYIIPPGIGKFGNTNIPNEILDVWRYMRLALSKAKNVICIGYSFPPNDVEFSTLFRLSLGSRNRALPTVGIVDPNKDIVDRVKNLVPGVKVQHLCNYLHEYIAI